MKDNEIETSKNGFFGHGHAKAGDDAGPAETEDMTETVVPEGAAGDGEMAAIKLDSMDAHWSVSIVGAFVGMLVGTLPATVWTMIFGDPFSPLFLFIPLFVFYGIKILRGYMGRRGFILTVLFTLLGLYLTALSCQAVGDVLKFGMSVINLPLVTIGMIGKKGVLPSPAFSAANVFPVVFTAIGAALAYELLRRKKPASTPEADEEVTENL